MTHPFDQEAVKAAHKAVLTAPTIGLCAEHALQAAWGSMFSRGKMVRDIKDGSGMAENLLTNWRAKPYEDEAYNQAIGDAVKVIQDHEEEIMTHNNERITRQALSFALPSLNLSDAIKLIASHRAQAAEIERLEARVKELETANARH